MTRRWTALALLVLGCSCTRKPAADVSPAVATYDKGRITAADIDRAVLDMPPQQRQPEDGDFLAWYERLARDLAFERLLEAEATGKGLEREPEFARARTEARKMAAVGVFLERELPRPRFPSEAQIKSYYDSHSAEFKNPGARQVFHIFRRVAPGADAAPVLAEMRRLRARAIGGEDFTALAAERSESESRHAKGLLGWIAPGQVAPELDRIVFALPVGVPSQPIETREGVHLFLVKAENPRRAYSLPEVRNQIAWRLITDERQAEIARRVGDGSGEPGFMPDAEALRALADEGDPQALVLQVGDFRVTLADLQRRLLAMRGDGEGTTPSPLAVLQSMRQRELVYRRCVAMGLDRDAEVEERTRRLLDRELASLRLRELLLESVDKDPERLREHYQANRGRFSEPMQVRIQKLGVPLSPKANDVMARLEQARGDLDAGRLTLDRLAVDVGGQVEETGWQTLAQVGRSEGRAAAFASALRPNQHSAPYRTATRIEMIRLLERREPAPLPFDQARDRVRADLLITHRHEAYNDLNKRVLDRARFQLDRARLEELVRRPVAAQ